MTFVVSVKIIISVKYFVNEMICRLLLEALFQITLIKKYDVWLIVKVLKVQKNMATRCSSPYHSSIHRPSCRFSFAQYVIQN